MVLNAAVMIPVFIIVIIAHELAHGYVAYMLGDSTAKDAGRLTINPIKHMDPVGTVVLPAMLLLMKSPVIFGWAKPVPVNPRNFANPRRGMFLTSLAGPMANFFLAILFALLLKTGLFSQYSVGWTLLAAGVLISTILGVFNLLPIPPLDGANIVATLLPPHMAFRFMRLERYGFIILIGLLYLGLFDRIILPFSWGLIRLILR